MDAALGHRCNAIYAALIHRSGAAEAALAPVPLELHDSTAPLSETRKKFITRCRDGKEVKSRREGKKEATGEGRKGKE